jgi:hypothetical protein
MITLKFYTIAERRPEDGQELIYLRRARVFDAVAFEPKEGTAEYCWFGLDEDGRFNGTQIGYQEGEPPPPNCRLEIMIGGWTLDEENYWWCPVEEFDDAFP